MKNNYKFLSFSAKCMPKKGTMVKMKKKNIGLIVAIAIVAVLIVIVGAVAILYFTTDIFKSNQEIFWKYLSTNSQMAKMVTSENETSQEQWKKNNSYTSEGNLKLAITKEPGTQELVIGTTSKHNNTNGRTYSDATLYNGNAELLKFSYINSGDVYALSNKDIYEPYYIGFRNSNLKEFARKLGLPEDTISQMPDSIPLDVVENAGTISDEESKYLLDTYFNVLISNIPKEKYAKLNKTNITIRDKKYETNGTSLTLNQEDIRQIIMAILTKAQEDEQTIAILNKLLAETEEQISAQEMLEELLKNVQEAEWEETTFNICVYHAGKDIAKTQININNEIELTIDIDLTQENVGHAIITVATINAETLEKQENFQLSMERQVLDNMINYTSSITTQTGFEVVMNTSLGNVLNGKIENSSKITIITEDATVETSYYKTIKQATEEVEIQELTNSNAVIVNNYPVEQLEVFFEGLGEKASTVLQSKIGQLNIQMQSPEDAFSYVEGIVSSLFTVMNANAVPQPAGIAGMVMTTTIVLKNQIYSNSALLNPSINGIEQGMNGTSTLPNNTVNSLTQQEIKAFNSKFEGYDGNEIIGTRVRTLLNTISSSNATYAGEETKIITVKLGGTGIEKPNGWLEAGENDATKILELRNSILAGYKYKIIMEKNSEGYIHTITIADKN